MAKTMKISTFYGIILGVIFTVLFLLLGRQFSSVFMRDDNLIGQTAYFVLCLSAPLLGVINMVTSYFQALGNAINSLIITALRNIILFIPGVIILNCFWQLNGIIAAQPVVESLLTAICIVIYKRSYMWNESTNLSFIVELDN